MLTPQEVSNHAFSKAVMGGYNMSMVDEFLDELTDDYTTLFKENAALKAKMKVLVDKVEEYRATEDSMRATLLTAQKMANTIVEDAEKQKLSLMAEAEQAAREKISTLQSDVASQQKRLEEGRRELNRFIRTSQALCQKQLEFLVALPELPVEQSAITAAPTAEETAASEIEGNILAAFGTNVFDAIVPKAEEPSNPVAPPAETPSFDEEEDEFLDATRRLNLKDLKFGRNYSGDN